MYNILKQISEFPLLFDFRVWDTVLFVYWKQSSSKLSPALTAIRAELDNVGKADEVPIDT